MMKQMRFIHRLAGLCAAATFCGIVGGCQSAATYSFNVVVQNVSSEPVTVWLTKRGGPEETDWLSPEALADTTAAKLDKINGVVIPTGKTGDLSITGKFHPGSLAILRVYAGELTLDQILATSPGGSLRKDIPLREGQNILTVKSPLIVERN